MKSKTTKRKIAEVAVGAAIGGAIAGPIGAVAGGLAAGHVESGLENLGQLKPPAGRSKPGAEDPIVHAHLKRILVPLDFSPPSRRALRFAREWAALFGAEIGLLHVVEPTVAAGEFGTVPMGQGQRDLAGRARAALQELVREEFPESPRVSVEVRKGSPSDQIAAVAGEWKADIIIIATHGRTGLKHALLGSTAERVVRHAPCPVLTLRRAPASKA
jgi:nucleotide-binding universal stress UspA family protein